MLILVLPTWQKLRRVRGKKWEREERIRTCGSSCPHTECIRRSRWRELGALQRAARANALLKCECTGSDAWATKRWETAQEGQPECWRQGSEPTKCWQLIKILLTQLTAVWNPHIIFRVSWGYMTLQFKKNKKEENTTCTLLKGEFNQTAKKHIALPLYDPKTRIL